MLLEILISAVLSSPDTVLTPAVAVAAKQVVRLEELPSPVTLVDQVEMRRYGIDSPKSVAMLVPGLLLPDYGASLTSTIYMRGLGSRMENPVLGLYIDDFPILDKNAYDFDYTWISLR